MASQQCTPELRDQDIGWRVQVTVLTTWIPLLFVVLARMIIKTRDRRHFGIDDYTMLVALVPISLGSIFHLIAVHYGLGQQTACLDLDDLSKTVKFQYLGEGMNILSVWIVKVSICFFLLRMIEGLHQKTRAFIWSINILNTLLQLVAFVVCWAAAKTPIWAWWDFTVTPNHDWTACLNYDRAVFIVNVVIDFIFAFSPIYFLWDTRIPKRTKYTLWALMLLALLPSTAGILKVVYLNQVVDASDPTYEPVKLDDLAALIEQNLGTIIANLPCIKVLLTYLATVVSQSYADLLSRASGRTTVRASYQTGTGPANYEDISMTEAPSLKTQSTKTSLADSKYRDRVGSQTISVEHQQV